jgi:hypothetical protein
LDQHEDQIKQHLMHSGYIKTDNDKELYDNDPASYMLNVLSKRNVIKDKKQLEFAFFTAYGASNRDAREYAMVYWGWKRIKGEWCESWYMTPGDMKILATGLMDAYDYELEQESEAGEEEITFNIEVRANNSVYYKVPIDVLRSGNPAKLLKYRR